MTRARYGEGALIACDNLVRIFKVADLEVVALQGLDLLVDAGEMIAIVGASGSGKSTLLNILGGLDVPSAGRAVVAGHDLAQMGRRERTRYRRRVVGFVWQQTARNLLPYLTRARERRAADDPRRRGAAAARAGDASCSGSSGWRTGATHRPGAPVGRRAAARRDRGRAGQRAGGRSSPTSRPASSTATTSAEIFDAPPPDQRASSGRRSWSSPTIRSCPSRSSGRSRIRDGRTSTRDASAGPSSATTATTRRSARSSRCSTGPAGCSCRARTSRRSGCRTASGSASRTTTSASGRTRDGATAARDPPASGDDRRADDR